MAEMRNVEKNIQENFCKLHLINVLDGHFKSTQNKYWNCLYQDLKSESSLYYIIDLEGLGTKSKFLTCP